MIYCNCQRWQEKEKPFTYNLLNCLFITTEEQLPQRALLFCLQRKDELMAARNKAEPKQEKKITGTVFGGGLRIRQEPDPTAEIKGVLPDGTAVEILEPGSEWHKIEQGYIMARWVKLDA